MKTIGTAIGTGANETGITETGITPVTDMKTAGNRDCAMGLELTSRRD
jgi:hypothetical protein